jgi:phage gp37-like protein
MKIIEVRDAIVTTMQEKLGDKVTVFAHGGTFDLAQINRYAAKAPAVVVSLFAMRDFVIEGTERVADLRWLIMIITRDLANENRGDQALAILEVILHLIGDQRWGVDGVQRTTNLNGANMFTAKVDAKGLAAWSLMWDQRIDMDGTFQSSLDDFKTLQTKWDLDTTDGIDDDAEDLISLPQ